MTTKNYAVYIITNKKNGVLYIGSTSQLKIRIGQHRRKVHPNAFSARYNLDRIVYYEFFETKEQALERERQLKRWNRSWKIKLIEKLNPNWENLYERI